MPVVKETFFDSWLRSMRLRQVLPYIRRFPDCVLLDIGCGWEMRLLHTVEPYVKFAEGLDFKAPDVATAKLRARRMTLSSRLPCDDASFDIVTMLAVLEHLEDPEGMASEIHRVLRPAGMLLLTVPSNAARPVLELLAYRLHVIDEAEIRDHKRYYNRRAIHEMFERAGFVVEKHRYFQLGMNNFAALRKK